MNYGGQAVIEGVMMRGEKVLTIAVRSPSGQIVIHSEPLDPKIYRSLWARIPFVRGLIMLWDAFALGLRALFFSANVALQEEKTEIKGVWAWFIVSFSLAVALALFFLLPALIAGLLEKFIPSTLFINLLEGVIRLGLFLGYIAMVSLWPDVRRVFAYHGAEHKAVNAYEMGAPLDPESIRRFGTYHPRCGTGFVLWVVIVSIIIFALLGKQPLILRLLTRLVLIPVIVMVSYEIIRFGHRYSYNSLVRAFMWPALALQSLTTRQPDDGMIEVALAALKNLLEMEKGEKPLDNGTDNFAAQKTAAL
ncbi:MAG: DUF1385 domain-containing protein [Anaerolineae bacterium]|nr:DUF1385 domain-containing protein [Anaerolineae bacterium]MDW8101767.1 DUF1385 domain-containing protein [Anaerolineae bacterium]